LKQNDEKKNVGMRATTRNPTLKIASVNDDDLVKVLQSLTMIKVVGCRELGRTPSHDVLEKE